MAVPKRKKSRSRRDMRRAHHDTTPLPSITTCTQCGSPTRPHTACPQCGTYRGRQVIKIEEITEDEKKP